MGLTLSNRNNSGRVSLRNTEAIVGTVVQQPWKPENLFQNGETGVWYDPSDFSTLYQDSAGTTPVTALGQPVGLMLDKANWDGRGVVNLLRHSQEFDQSSSWTNFQTTDAANATTAPDGTLTADELLETAITSGHTIYQSATTTSGAVHCISVFIKPNGRNYAFVRTSDSFGSNLHGVSVDLINGTATNAVGTTNNISCVIANNGFYRISFSFTATTNARLEIITSTDGVYANRSYLGDNTKGLYIWGAQLEVGSTATAYQPNGAVVGGPGNHASQSTTAARPTVQARVNLLERTEEFDQSPTWQRYDVIMSSNEIVAPNGTTTADKLAQNTNNAFHYVRQQINAQSGEIYTFSVYVKAAGYNYFQVLGPNPINGANSTAIFNLQSGQVGPSILEPTIKDVGDGWFSVTTKHLAGTSTFAVALYSLQTNIAVSEIGDGTSGVYLWGAQVEVGSTATKYQRVTTATDYADIGLPRYLQFDGTDDSLSSTSIDFSSSDEIAICAGIVDDDSDTGYIAELSSDSTSNDGSFALQRDGDNNRYIFNSRGTTNISTISSPIYPSPEISVITGISDISQQLLKIRVDGDDDGTNTNSAGSGNYGDHSLYIGSRNNSSDYFKGKLHQLVVRDKVPTTGVLKTTENYVARRTGTTAAPYSPALLFQNGEVGAWYDPSDFSTLYQDSAGTTPVTALGQPVGLMLDKANWDGRGVVNLLRYTEQFDDAIWSTSPTGIVAVTADQAVAPDGQTTADLVEFVVQSDPDVGIRQTITSPSAGETYTWSVFAKATASSVGDEIQIRWKRVGGTVYGTSNIALTLTNDWQRVTVTGTLPAGATGITAQIWSNEATEAYLWGAQLEEGSTATAYQPNGAGVGGPGNHAAQSTSAARPTVQARVNLLERTEEFTNAYWNVNQVTRVANQAVAPDGTVTADLIYPMSSGSYRIVGYATHPTATMASIYAKAAGFDYLAIGYGASVATYALFDLANGVTGTKGADITASSIQDVGDGWYRCEIYVSTGIGELRFGASNIESIAVTASGTSGIYVWGAQLEPGSTATTYQRVTTDTDYEDIGLPRYLEFDGVDDAMSTPSVDFTGTDEMTVISGIRADATTGMVVELSSSSNVNAGAFRKYVDSNGKVNPLSGGTTSLTITGTSNVVGQNIVASILADISTPIFDLKVDGALDVSDNSSQGTGNYGDYPLYIGARGGTTLEFNGRIHQLIIRDKTTSGPLLDKTERYVATKTGLTLRDGSYSSFSWDSSTSSPSAV